MSHENLFEVASQARQLFEHRLVARPLLRELYLAYNPEIEVESFLDQAESLFPAFNCGLATVYLQHQLGDGVIHNGTYNGQGHTFLEFQDTIVDITADQFGGPSVYAGPLALPWSLDKPITHQPA